MKVETKSLIDVSICSASEDAPVLNYCYATELFVSTVVVRAVCLGWLG